MQLFKNELDPFNEHHLGDVLYDYYKSIVYLNTINYNNGNKSVECYNSLIPDQQRSLVDVEAELLPNGVHGDLLFLGGYEEILVIDIKKREYVYDLKFVGKISSFAVTDNSFYVGTEEGTVKVFQISEKNYAFI